MIKKAIISLLAALMLLTGVNINTYAAPATASVSSFKGDVKIYKSGGAKAFKPYNGMKLAEGDMIETGASSSVTMKSGKKTTTIGSDSKVTVDSLWDAGNSKSASVTVVEGSVLNKVEDTLNVNSKDQIRTSTTVAGVRGTEYIFEYKRGAPVKIKMLEGTLNLSDITGSTGTGHGDSSVNSSTVFLSTDQSFIREYGGDYSINPPQNDLNTEDVNREILIALAEDPETQIKYPELYREIVRVLENEESAVYKDILSAIEEIKKKAVLLREGTAKVLKDNDVTKPPQTGSGGGGGGVQTSGEYTLIEPPIVTHTYGNELDNSTILGGVCVLKDTETQVRGTFTWAESSGRINAGMNEVRVLFTPDNSNYKPTEFIVVARISERQITNVTCTLTATKLFDGTEDLPVELIKISDLEFEGKLPEDELTLVIGSARFLSVNIGDMEFVCTDLSLGGSSAGNYWLSNTDQLYGLGSIDPTQWHD